jgi:hypothetical protein
VAFARLLAERQQFAVAKEDWLTERDMWNAELEQWQQERAELLDQLRAYGRHEPDCPKEVSGDRCMCLWEIT